MSKPRAALAVEKINRQIHFIRGQRVMIDSDLAEPYEVSTGNLNLAVRRNLSRFPSDFMFQLTLGETRSLLLQFAIANVRGGRRSPPFAFTEHGVAMLASVLNSDRAVTMSIVIIRTFVKLREVLANHKELGNKLEKVEETQRQHASVIRSEVDEIDRLTEPEPLPAKRRIGFTAQQK